MGRYEQNFSIISLFIIIQSGDPGENVINVDVKEKEKEKESVLMCVPRKKLHLQSANHSSIELSSRSSQLQTLQHALHVLYQVFLKWWQTWHIDSMDAVPDCIHYNESVRFCTTNNSLVSDIEMIRPSTMVSMGRMDKSWFWKVVWNRYKKLLMLLW